MRAFLIDLDGVLYVGSHPIPGARECLERMDDLGYGYRFVSNSTRKSCYLLTTSDVRRDFQQAGISIVEDGAECVVVGDAAEGFTFEKLNQAL
ncbi:MAG: TIGR01458 family HAD-type hydrolase, partial [Methanothrix sp.]|nr:TIGR01458 family HAD-type hydrolase [Methanothrix sp.]